ncbi:MAG: fimbrial biogenesis chaperone [Planctomycetota bacterium]|jgi:hypothetical protein
MRIGRWVGLLLIGMLLASSAMADEIVLLDFEGAFKAESVEARDAKVRVVGKTGQRALRIRTGHQAAWPGITLEPVRDVWNLARFRYLEADLRNVGSSAMGVSVRIDSPGGNGKRGSITGHLRLEPGEAQTLRIRLDRTPPDWMPVEGLFAMRGLPGGYRPGEKTIDPARIIQLIVFTNRPDQDHAFEIDAVRAGGSFVEPAWVSKPPKPFSPFVDALGQFKHATWPGKTSGDDALSTARAAEARDLEAHPGPAGWNLYGGWAGGPQLEATGRFRTAKHEGRWWLVDPEGKLFFSHGLDGVRFRSETPITGREGWFTQLPQADSPFAAFYGTSKWARSGYHYHGKTPFRTFDFASANLRRKYGETWRKTYPELVHQRLRSWGLNSIGAWSHSEVRLARRTPYTVALGTKGRRFEVWTAHHFPDPFDPEFKRSIERSMERERKKSAGDPWCLGYFVDNELTWDRPLALARGVLRAPPDQPAKLAFLSDLKARHKTIDRLNEVWATDHKSWEALLDHREEPDRERARADLEAFDVRLAERYFQTCRDAIKAVDPKALYLGCRFSVFHPTAVEAAARYTDVISFNRYQWDLSAFAPLPGLDRPIVIGEFHFGALDRGLFHEGLRAVDSQQARADAYRTYVRSAVRHPLVVGCHWFTYRDEPVTGRPGDGENYQIGFVDVCDAPYPEIRDAARDAGAGLYSGR